MLYEVITCATERMDAEDTLFILYTSGSTGKPKAILHTHGGYMVGTYTTLKYVITSYSIHYTKLYEYGKEVFNVQAICRCGICMKPVPH